METIKRLLADIAYYKITQQEIAEKVGRSDRTVRNWMAEPLRHADKMILVGDAVAAIREERKGVIL